MSFTFGNSTIGDVYFGAIKIGSAYQGSTLVYQSVVPYTVLFEDLNTYTGTGLKMSTGQLTSSKNFIVITFKLSTNTTNADSYTYLRTSTDTSKNIWCGNARKYGAYAYASYFISSASGWNAFVNPVVGSDGTVSSRVYYLSTSSSSNYNSYKIIFDVSNHKAYCYINNMNILNADVVTFSPLNFEAGTDGSNVTFGTIRVYACETLAEAQQITE